MNFPKTMWTHLLQLIRIDPERARDVVTRGYRQAVYEFALHERLPHEDAEDVTQEVFLRVCDSKFLQKADRAKGKFRSLILAVASHVIASHRRKELAGRRDRRRQVPLGEFEIPEKLEANPEFDRLWARNLVTRAIERLDSDPYVAALRLQMEGKSYQEIAARLGKSVTDVTNYVHRAKKKLKAEIEKLIWEYCSREDSGVEISELVRYL